MAEQLRGIGVSASTDSFLLRQAQAQDQDAWSELVRLYGPLVSYWCRQGGLPEADRADVFQEVFRSVSSNLGGFRRDEAGHTFRGWIRTITRSKIADHYRRRKKHPAGAGGTDAQLRIAELAAPEDPSHDETSDAAEVDELSRQALKIMQERFEENTWKAFWRTAIDGQPASDVGDELGMKPEAVRKAKSRVLHRLKEQFGHLLE